MEEFLDRNIEGKNRVEKEENQMGKSNFWNKSKQQETQSKKQSKAKSSPVKNSRIQKKDWNNGMGESGKKKE